MENVYVHRVKGVVFSMFGFLRGDFCKDTYEAKLFRMHIGSVLSGLYEGNVNIESNIPLVGMETYGEGSKMSIFRF